MGDADDKAGLEFINLAVPQSACVSCKPGSDNVLHWSWGEFGGLKNSKRILDGLWPGSFEDKVELTFSSPWRAERDDRGRPKRGSSRALICSCFGGRFISGTFRGQEIHRVSAKAVPESGRFRIGRPHESALFQVDEIATSLLEWLQEEGGSDSIDDEKRESKAKRPMEGLVVVAGSTNSCKTNIAQAFALSVIQQYMKRPGGPIPHLVTFEDPIEKWIVTLPKFPKTRKGEIDLSLEPALAAKFGFAFTPRQASKDVTDLAQALRDARRQTPKCFYIGEVRSASDWAEILDFAGSGHLVVATTHAASVTGAIARILKSQRAITPFERGSTVRNILGCVHLRIEQLGRNGLVAVLPSAWKGDSDAVQGLVGDGLDAVVSTKSYFRNRRRWAEILRHRWNPNIGVSIAKRLLEGAAKLDAQEILEP